MARKDHANLPGIETARLRPFTLDDLEREAPPYKDQDVLYYEISRETFRPDDVSYVLRRA